MLLAQEATRRINAGGMLIVYAGFAVAVLAYVALLVVVYRVRRKRGDTDGAATAWTVLAAFMPLVGTLIALVAPGHPERLMPPPDPSQRLATTPEQSWPAPPSS